MRNRTSIFVILDLGRHIIGTRKYPGLALLMQAIKNYIFFMILSGFILCFKRFKAISAKIMSSTKGSILYWSPEGV